MMPIRMIGMEGDFCTVPHRLPPPADYAGACCEPVDISGCAAMDGPLIVGAASARALIEQFLGLHD
jgi:hypothetical protein